MLELAMGIMLGLLGLGAGCAMIAGIGPGIGEGNAGVQERRHLDHDHGLRHRGDHRSVRPDRGDPADLCGPGYLHGHSEGSD